MLGLRQRRARTFKNEDLARFIGTHRACGGGMDVSRLGPSTQIRCKGCGEAIVRGGPIPEHFIEQVAARQRADGEVALRLPPPGLRPAGTSRRGPALRLPRFAVWWRAAALLGLLVAAAVLAVLITGGDSRSESGGMPQSAAAPAPAPPAVPAQPPTHKSSASLPFIANLPRGWHEGRAGEGVVFAPGAPDRASVSVYFERSSSLPPTKMAPAAAELLRDRHRGARVGDPQPARLGGKSALSVVAVYPGGRETALVSAAGGYRYLVIQTLSGDADRDARAEAQQLLEDIKLDRR